MHNAATTDGRASATPNATECEVHREILDQVWDLCVVGSGPGGAVVAATGVKRGQSVLIIEAGGPVNESVEHHSVAQMMADFENGGQEIAVGPSPVPFAQGRTWGGGSEINSGLYHHLPNSVATRWRKAAGLSAEQLNVAVLEVEAGMPVHKQPAYSLGCYADSPIEGIRSALGWKGGVIPRWREYKAKGFTHFGMSSTFLATAIEGGAARVTRHRVTSIMVVAGGVAVRFSGPSCAHELVSKSVSLSAGTVGTPEILWRSKLARPREFSFAFHAMIREVAEYERIVNDLVDIDPHQAWSVDNQFKVGAAVSTPELLAATMAQKGLPYPTHPEHCAAIYISFASDGKNGLFQVGKHLYPYFVPSRAMKSLAEDAGRVLRDGISESSGRALGEPKNGYSTVHVFGSLPLGTSNVVDDNGVVRGTNGRVFVRDASIIPSHPLVNPQGPLMHLVTALENKRVDA